MKKMFPIVTAFLLTVSAMTLNAETATINTSEGTITIKLLSITIKLLSKEAPVTVANFVGLAEGTKEFQDPKTGKMVKYPFFNGLTFHRVISGFMIQGGDPLGNGTGGPGYQFDNENTNANFNKAGTNANFNKAGVVAMANAGKDTNGSQFFITVAPTPSLQGSYNVFGEVIAGQDVADKISKVPTNPQDKPLTPVVIKSITIDK